MDSIDQITQEFILFTLHYGSVLVHWASSQAPNVISENKVAHFLDQHLILEGNA